MATLLTPPKIQFFDVNGNVLSGGEVYFYAAGTSTPQDTYADKDQSVTNANPVVLDSRGEAVVYLGNSDYKVVVKDSSGNTIWTEDNIRPNDQGLRVDLASTASGDGADLVANVIRVAHVDDYGAAGDGSTDDSTEIQNAINSGARIVVLNPAKTYAIASALSMSANGQRLVSFSGGGFGAVARLKWTGSDGASHMLKIDDGTHNAGVIGVGFDANSKANICVHVEILDGSSTKHPVLEHLDLRGYKTHGLVIGENTTASGKNGQAEQAHLRQIVWRGGSVNTAIGWFMNAQNVEFAECSGLYFDPWPGGGYANHDHHILVKRGALNISALVTTRADSYVIESEDQVIVRGWRAEDEFLLNSKATDPNAPIAIEDVMQRGTTPSSSGTNVVLLSSAGDMPVSLRNCHFRGSVILASASAKSVWAENVTFEFAADSIKRSGGTPVSYTFMEHDVANGQQFIQASAPTHLFWDQSENVLFKNDSGKLSKVTSVSSTSTEGENLAGQLTISDTATNQTVTFSTAEPDGQYRLAVTPEAQSGTPASGSNRVLKVVKGTTDFTVHVEAAPGAGNSVTFDWLLLR